MDDKEIQAFISKTAKSKVAVIIPLFGYWSDDKESALNVDTLKLTMDRVQSSLHNIVVFFVGDPAKTPKKIQNYILAYNARGNSQGVKIDKNAGYAEYVYEGLRVAHETTDAAYLVVLNPWNIIQHIGIDMMVDRLNLGDDAKIVSGYDLGKVSNKDEFDIEAFENYFMHTPKEERAINCNFFGITRYAYEMLNPDINIKTHKFMERDFWQGMFTKSFEAISSQRIPMFVFDVSIEELENPADVESDKQYFQKKWGFIPEL